MPRIAENIAETRRRIADAADRSGRSSEDVSLLIVTKYHTVDEIRAVYDTGHRLVGENRVQEAQEKVPQLPDDLEWHMIGHIQTNKARFIPPLFTVAHSVDRLKVARALDKSVRQDWEDTDRSAPFHILLEVNVSGEESKFGLAPDDAEDCLRQAAGLETLRIRGLMTMAPHVDDPETVRPVFRRLRELRERLRDLGLPRAPMDQLSMGMSNDFEIAVEEGATIIRVGSAIFQ